MNNKIALAGVPNCGKTTLWNLSTGKSGKIGNWPGVTAEKLSAPLLLFPKIELIDLPGMYSLSGKSLEEIAAKNFLKTNEADSLIIIIDGTKPEPGLYLALELLSLKIPSVIGINFSDEMKKRRISVDTEKLSTELGIPVFLISAKKRFNTDKLISCAKNLSTVPKNKFCFVSEKEKHEKAASLMKSFFCFENSCSQNSGKFVLALPFFVLIVLLFLLSAVLKNIFSFFLEHFTAFCGILLNHTENPFLRSFLLEGAFPGIGSVLLFIPDLFTVFLTLSFLEDSGFMARTAFLSDYLLKEIGLSGRSIIPMLIGLGCSVPAIYSVKSSDDDNLKKRTLSALMFVPCSARLPLLLLFCENMFPFGKFSFLFFYLAVFLIGTIFMKLSLKNPSSGFVLELPEIRVPSVKSILKNALRRLFSFMAKAPFVIVFTSVLIWVLKNFSPFLKPVELPEESALFIIGNFLLFFFRPVGIPLEGIIALFCGLFAKESALFALVSLCGDISSVFDAISSISFLLFFMIYSPCAAALVSIKNEFGIKKAVWLFVRQTVLAYFVSFSFYQFAMLIKNIFIP